jgi:cytidine diphosphoramidate kinase
VNAFAEKWARHSDEARAAQGQTRLRTTIVLACPMPETLSPCLNAPTASAKSVAGSLATENRPSMAGRVIWITGLSGAGKTTLATELAQRLRGAGQAVISLDGDDLRRVWAEQPTDEAGYSREERIALGVRYARLAKLLSSQNHIVIVATISLFREVHIWNRKNIPGYFEVYLRAPLEELRRRDPKGIYRKYEAGELKNVAGLDLDVDEPDFPDLLLDVVPHRTAGAMAEEVLSHLMGSVAN